MFTTTGIIIIIIGGTTGIIITGAGTGIGNCYWQHHHRHRW
jgi:hypothetical protein